MKRLCLYHADCSDGFACAWLLHNHYKDKGGITLVPAKYGEEIDLKDQTFDSLILADFSLKEDALWDLVISLGLDEVVVLDHHKTAEKYLAVMTADDIGLPLGDLEIIYDEKECGATLVCQYLGIEPSKMIRYIKDRDLWQWQLFQSREISASIGSYPKTLDAWDTLGGRMEDWTQEIADEGDAILRAQEQSIQQCLKNIVRFDLYDKDDIFISLDACYCTNTNLISELGHRLAEESEERMGLIISPGPQFTYSLRSIGDVDCSKVAERMGGGGHKNAAGFIVKNAPDFCFRICKDVGNVSEV